MKRKLLFDKLNWLTEQKIGKVYSFKIFGWHITIHLAKYYKGHWFK